MTRLVRLSVLLSPVLLGALAAACQSGGASSTDLTDADRATLRQADEAFARAAVAKDFASTAANYLDDATLMPPNGPAVQGREAIRKWMASFPPFSDFKVEVTDVDGRGDVAYTSGTYSMTMAPANGPPTSDRGKFLEVWRKQPDGTWKIKRDIFNSDLPAAPTPATKS